MTVPAIADPTPTPIAERRPSDGDTTRTLARWAASWSAARTARATRRATRRAARRAAALTAAASFGRAARPVVPLMLVTGFAGIGQVLWALDHVAPPDWVWPLRIAMAIGAAGAVESISLNVQWHAHDAHVHGRMSSAARLRRASYAIAGLVAAINYAHFAAPGGGPTPAAVMFALFSASSPWLWGLHTRRVREIHLAESGASVDITGAEFSPIRWRLFPLRTYGAWRWSVDHSITDPQRAWDGYRADRAEHRAARTAIRSGRTSGRDHDRATGRSLLRKIRNDQPSPPGTNPDPAPEVAAAAPPAEQPARPVSVALATVTPPVVRADTSPRRPTARRPRRPTVRRPGGPARSDADALAAARAHAKQHGPITSRSAFRRATGTGGDRSERLFDLYQRETTEETP